MTQVKGREREGFGGRGVSDPATYTGHGPLISTVHTSFMSEKAPVLDRMWWMTKIVQDMLALCLQVSQKSPRNAGFVLPCICATTGFQSFPTECSTGTPALFPPETSLPEFTSVSATQGGMPVWKYPTLPAHGVITSHGSTHYTSPPRAPYQG